MYSIEHRFVSTGSLATLLGLATVCMFKYCEIQWRLFGCKDAVAFLLGADK